MCVCVCGWLKADRRGCVLVRAGWHLIRWIINEVRDCATLHTTICSHVSHVSQHRVLILMEAGLGLVYLLAAVGSLSAGAHLSPEAAIRFHL